MAAISRFSPREQVNYAKLTGKVMNDHPQLFQGLFLGVANENTCVNDTAKNVPCDSRFILLCYL